MGSLVIGVDVGTGSARAGAFDANGQRLGYGAAEIELWRFPGERVEQSSANIWRAVVEAIKRSVETANASPNDVAGLGFDATCSLVLSDRDGEPLALGDGQPARDVIVWMDHRAVGEAEEITATGDAALEQVGGVMSPEMQLPKLLWLKRNAPDLWRRLGAAHDLSDWLTWRATGDNRRSSCTTVCKWCLDYRDRIDGDGDGWPRQLLDRIEMIDLLNEDRAKVGREIDMPGSPIGRGLSAAAASELGLLPGTPVGVSAIDAHAGAIGILASGAAGKPTFGRLAMITGTSNCHLVLSQDRLPVPGVWGPYFGALTGAAWLAEAGQSAAGAFLDRLIEGHPAREASTTEEYARLDGALAELLAERDIDRFLGDRLVLPDFLGNRSPIADPTMTGAMTGLTLDADRRDLARTYLAGLFALAYGTRHIVEALEAGGHAINAIVATGSGSKNRRLMQAHADATGLPVYLPSESEGVLLGSAMLAARAAALYPSLENAMASMCSEADRIDADIGSRPMHDRRYHKTRALQDFLRGGGS